MHCHAKNSLWLREDGEYVTPHGTIIQEDENLNGYDCEYKIESLLLDVEWYLFSLDAVGASL